MKKTYEKSQKSNRGFTLIEMIVTVAIIAIFGGVLSTLIGTGANLFRGVSNNTKTQVNAQQVLDEMEDLIIDANRSVYYAYGTSENIGDEITNDIDDSNTRSKTFIVCNEYKNGDGTSRYIFDVIDWDGSEGKIYYSQRQYVKASSSQENDSTGEDSTEDETAVFAAGDNTEAAVFAADSQKAKDSQELIKKSVFAEGIESFGADVSKVQSDRIVRFRLTTDSGGKKVRTLHTVNLRNRIQVMKPDDAFADAQVTDISISIINVPDAIDAGASWILKYETKGNGDIDPTTVIWTVVDGSGSFPPADPTYGKLTADSDATGTITVKVSAKTSDGKTIESAPVSIPVNNKRTITGIVPSQDTIVLAAGISAFDLNSQILWNIQYSDGTKGNDNLDVTWQTNCSFASISSDGKLTIPEESGTENTGIFTVSASNTAAGVSGEITVKVARIDITVPQNKSSFQVGDDRALSYIYREGGQIAGQRNGQNVEEVAPVITVLNHPSTVTGENVKYDGTGQFETQDIGNWTIQAQVNLDTAGRGYGTVQAKSAFTVTKKLPAAQIITSGSSYAVLRGGEYTCYIDERNNNFGMKVEGLDWYTSTIKIEWSIEGTNTDTEVKEDPKDDKKAKVIVGENAQGFILCAKCIKHTTWGDNTPIEFEVTAKRYIAVATEMAISSPPAIVEKGEIYDLTADVTMNKIRKNIDGTYTHYEEVVSARNTVNADLDWKNAAVTGSMLTLLPKSQNNQNNQKAVQAQIKEDASETEGLLEVGMVSMDDLIPNPENKSAPLFSASLNIRIKRENQD